MSDEKKQINLFDPACEPSDEDFAKLMESYASEVQKRCESVTNKLHSQITHEMLKSLSESPSHVKA